MAGDNEFLDMSLIDYIPTEETKQEETPVRVEENEIKNIADDTKSQEIVGNQEEEKSEEIKDKPKSPANSDEVLFTALAENLKERGFFSTLDKEIKNEDDLAEAFKAEIKKSEFAQLNPTQREYLEALQDGVPEELIQGHIKNRSIFNNITDEVLEDNADVRKQVIIQERMALGWTQERAERDYKRLQDLGEELEEAKQSTANLKQMELERYQADVEITQQQKQAEIERDQERLEELKQAVFKENVFLGSLKVDEGLKTKVYDTMTTIVGEVNHQPVNALLRHRAENPVDFETKLYTLYVLTNGFTDLNRFVTKATTIASKKMTEAIQNSTIMKGAGNDGIPLIPDENDYSSPISNISFD